jgi:hypothetical protein
MTNITGEVHLTVPPILMGTLKEYESFLAAANELAHGLDPLSREPGASIALTFVAGQVAECALKAIICFKDPTCEPKEVGHDLESAWKRAQSHLTHIGEPPAWLVTLSGLHNAPFPLRYLKGINGVCLPVLPDLVAGVKALLSNANNARVTRC